MSNLPRFGWRDDPAARSRIVAGWPKHFGRPAALVESNPDWIGDGLTGDVCLWKAYGEVEVPGWKEKGKEPPYKTQPGNDCTAESTARGIDLLQFIEAAAPTGETVPAWQGPGERACIEAIYAYGLAAAGMRGDQGCYGAAIAKGLQANGVVPYARVQGSPEVDAARLRQFANNPTGVVSAFREVSAPFRIEASLITTWEAACAWWANRGVVTVASNVGFEARDGSIAPRDERGIVRAGGTWPHQMVSVGCIRSDGVETAVFLQSWGPNKPAGPTPFGLPTFAFRVVRSDFERILAQQDCWGYRNFTGFKRSPVPDRWSYDALA